MKNIVRLIVAVIIAQCVFLTAASYADTFKVGMIASLTGAAGEQGKNWVDGAMLAVKDLARDGVTVEANIDDDATNPAQAVAAFQRFANLKKVQAIIGGTWDYIAEPLFSLSQQYKIPFVTPSNPVEILSDKDKQNPYIFVAGLSVASMQDAFRKLVREKKPKTATLIYPQVPFGEMQATAFKQVLQEEHIQLVDDSAFPPADYLEILKTDALKIKAHHPDMVYIVTNYSGLDELTGEFKKLGGVNPILVTSQHLQHAFEFSKDPPRYTNTYGIYPSSILNERFAEDFAKEYGHAPRVYAAEGYDAMKFLALAHKQGLDITAPNTTFKYEGISGVYTLPCPPGVRSPVSIPAVMMTTTDGSFVPYR